MGRPHLSLALIALALACPGSAAAAAFHRDRTPLPASVAGGASEGSSGAVHASTTGSFARMIVGLAIVIAVIYGVYWLLKAYGRSKGNQGLRDDGRMTVVATTALAPNRSLHLVRVGDELVLVGSADGGLTQLRVYSADEARRFDPELEGPAPARGTVLAELRKRTAR